MKEKEALERKAREEQERKRREDEEARKEKEEKEKLGKQKEDAERKAPLKEPENFSGKGTFVFGLIFVILLIGAVAMFSGNSDHNNNKGNQSGLVTTPSKKTGDSVPKITAKANNVQTSSLQSSDIYTNSIGMEFVKIPVSEFMMGSPSKKKDRNDDEGPVHKVMVKEPYYLGKFEVTQEQWNSVMGDNPSNFKGDDLPVEQVSWDDVQDFINKLNQMEGTDKYRLPSEAEWEYACRAGRTTRYSFGDDDSKLGDCAWYSGYATFEEWDKNWDKIEAKTHPHPVGQKKTNLWGLYDMHGNVWEWCQDKWHDNYDVAPSDGSAWEDGSSSDRVLRGGGWYNSAEDCRSASRGGFSPINGNLNIGFRLLRDP